MPPTNHIYIALGSNLGNRITYLQAGVDGLSRYPNINLVDVSSVYESPAHVLPHQKPPPDYLNAVLRCETSLSSLELLDVCLAIETANGRIRHQEERWAPRTLDLDLLVFKDLVLNSERLILPHPRLGERKFVLKPLAEIAPNLLIPAPFNQTVRYLLETCLDPSEVSTSDHVLTLPGD